MNTIKASRNNEHNSHTLLYKETKMNVDDDWNLIELISAYDDFRLYSIDGYNGLDKAVALERIERIYLDSSYIVRLEFKTLFCDSIGYELAAVFERLDF